MKCERCRERDATQAVRAEQDGRTTDLFVCNQCAHEQTPKTPAVLSLADILFSLGQASPGATAATPGAEAAGGAAAVAPPAVCRRCGMTRAALQQNRRFGCPECYRAFPELVAALLRELQYGDRHAGKTPRGAARHRKIAALRNKMAAAIEAQRYEEAAALRDRLLRLLAEPQPPHQPTERNDAG